MDHDHKIKINHQMLTRLNVVIILQYIQIMSHYVVYLKLT